MIETTIPEIDVSELTARVRAKAAEMAKVERRARRDSSESDTLLAPTPDHPESLPSLTLPDAPPARKARVLALLADAQRSLQVGRWIPKPIRRFFRKQGTYNRSLIESVGLLAKANGELAARLEHLILCVGVQRDWLQEFHQRSGTHAAWIGSAVPVLQKADQRAKELRSEAREQFDSTEARVAVELSELRRDVTSARQEFRNAHDTISGEMRTLRHHAESAGEHLVNLQIETIRNAEVAQNLQVLSDQLWDGFGTLRADGERTGEHVTNLQQETDRNTEIASGLQTRFEQMWEGFRTLRADGERTGAHVINLQQETDRNTERASALQTRFEQLWEGFRTLRADGENTGEHVTNLQQETNRNTEMAAAFEARLEQLQDGFATLRGDGERAGAHLANLQEETNRNAGMAAVFLGRLDEIQKGFEALRGDGQRTGKHLSNLQGQLDQNTAGCKALADTLRELQKSVSRAGDHLRNLQTINDRNSGALERLRPDLDRLANEGIELQRAIARLDERQTTDGAFLKTQLSQHGALLRQWRAAAFSVKAKKSAPNRKDILTDLPYPLDAFYVSFEDRFRGPRREIKKRVEIYLPYLKRANAGRAKAPVLDVGCGRGEWLELLKEHKLKATGVDLNSAMLKQCQQRNLSAVRADAVEHLRTLPAASHGAVTGFHLIEHLGLEALMDLIAEASRVLVPGGVAIFESPNCKNLVVGASNFNIDPTHRNPVFPETAQFMLEMHGFEKCELKYLAPVEAERFAGTDRKSKVLNELLYGPQDFAVIGHKPGSR